MDSAIPGNHKKKIKESEKINKYLVLAWELKKTVDHEGAGDTSCDWCTLNSSQKLLKKMTNSKPRKNWDHSDHSVVDWLEY